MNKEKVSVLMTVFNAENYLQHSIQSIKDQSYSNWELIIVDDCSTDKSTKILKKIKSKKIKVFFLKKKIGRTKALNYSLKKAKGKYLAVLDADDVSYKNRLQEQVNYLKKNKDIYLIGSWYLKIDKNNKVLEKVKTITDIEKIKQIMIYKNIFVHSSVMFNKKVLKSIGVYPTKFVYMQDYGFILKVMTKFKISLIPKILTKSRIIRSSMTFNISPKQINHEREIILFFTWLNFKKNIFTSYFWIIEYIKVSLKKIIF